MPPENERPQAIDTDPWIFANGNPLPFDSEVPAVKPQTPETKSAPTPIRAVQAPEIGYHEAVGELNRLHRAVGVAGRAMTEDETVRKNELESVISKAENAARQAISLATAPGSAGLSARSRIDNQIKDYEKLTDAQREALKRQINTFGLPIDYQAASEQTGVNAMLIREAMETQIAKLRAELEGEMLAEKNRYESSLEFVMPLIEDAKLPIREKLARAEKLDLEGQRKAIRYILRTEFEKPENVPGTAEFNRVRSDLEAMKDRFQESVKREIDARVHLQACSSSLRKINTGDVANISNEFSNAVRGIGALAINNEDLNFFLGDDRFQVDGQPHGLNVRVAIEVMDSLALRGHYSGKKSESERLRTKELLRETVSSRTGITEDEALDEVLMLADNLSEAIFLKARWDTSGGDYGAQSYLSRALYFSTSRSSGDKPKPPIINIPDVHCLGTGFLDSLKGASGEHLFFADRANGIKDAPFLDRRMRALARSTILTESMVLGIADWELGNDPENTRLVNRTQPMLDSGLDFRGVDFREVSSRAYADFLSKKVPAVITAYDLMTNTKITVDSLLKDNDLLGYAKIIDEVDPDNLHNLKFYFALGALSVALDNGAERSEINRAIDNLTEVKVVGGKRSSFLPANSGLERMLKDRIAKNKQGNQGITNALLRFLEGRVRTSR